jgi:hypothetical protein
VKQVCSPILMYCRIFSGGSSDSTSMRVYRPRPAPRIVPASAEPLMENRVSCSIRTLLMSNLAIFPYRESWVSTQKATATLKYTSGGGAVSSPPR